MRTPIQRSSSLRRMLARRAEIQEDAEFQTMSDVADKLRHAGVALRDVQDLRREGDQPKLLARFTGYASQVSAVRQHIQNALRTSLADTNPNDAQRWFHALE